MNVSSAFFRSEDIYTLQNSGSLRAPSRIFASGTKNPKTYSGCLSRFSVIREKIHDIRKIFNGNQENFHVFFRSRGRAT